MAWIEVHQSLFTHRKTLALADRFDMPEVHVAGHLIALWTWALDNAPDGILPESHKIIARASQWDGDATVWLNALIADGFLEDALPGGFAIHDWHEYAGRLIQRRKANAQRMKEARANNEPSIDRERATHVQRTNDARAGATVPNSTQPNRTVQNQTDTSAPDEPAAVAVPSEPYQHFEAFCVASGIDPDTVTKSAKSQQLRSAKEIVQAGYVPDQTRRCAVYMRSESWRETPPDLSQVAKFLPRWKAMQEPSEPVSKSLAIANGRASPGPSKAELRARQGAEEALSLIGGDYGDSG